MFQLHNYRLTVRIGSGFLILTLLFALLGGLGLLALGRMEAALLAGQTAAGVELAASLRQLIGGVLLLAMLTALGMAWATHVSFSRPVERVVQVVTRIAGGDLATRIESQGRDEFAWLSHELNAMRKKLQQALNEVRSSAEQVEAASSEIASGNNDLSARTETQAGSLQQTASSMMQLTGTVKQNADSARQANELVMAASDVASRGGQVMGQVVATMQAINGSAQKINDIIGVIDGIAFQTNILALNAAVEAARAGEQGRGFAVVAGEVRNLAQRSAQAAKEIKTLIGDSVDRASDGARQVDEAGATMQEILASVQKVTAIMGEIRHASEEQSAGIQQINQAIDQMDGVTQQNAALVEQAAAAAGSLREQAQKLTGTVAVFRLAA